MKKIFLPVLFVTVALVSAKAQYASLSNDEVAKLAVIVKQDAAAAKLFGKYQYTADRALTETPNPIEEITSEGMLAGHPDKIKSLKAVEDADKVYALALVYKTGGNKTYLDKAVEYLLAWSKVNKSSGDPIDETKLEDMFSGYDLLRNDVNPESRKAIDVWMQSIADTEYNSDYAKPGASTAVNNWNSHRIKIIAMIAYTLHIKKYEKLIAEEMEKQIAINLYADGSGHDFKERDALHYHIYTLEPLVMAAITIYRATGKDYFNYVSPKGSSIKKSMDFLEPFVTGEKTHGEFLNSVVEFDKARAKNGEKGYEAGSKFSAKTGIYVMELASYFDKKYADDVLKTFGQTSHESDWQLVLNKARKPK